MDYSKFRLRSFTGLHPFYFLPCGSYYELPIKFCLENPTDVDVIFYYYGICAIPWNRNPPKNTKCTVLRIDSKQTPPGFVRLMVDRDNTEDNPTYFRRPPVLKGVKSGGPSKHVEKMLTDKGRAATLVNRPVEKLDIVLAVYCPYWPVEAEEWRERKRYNGWPNEKLIARVARGGCHFVSKLRTWSSSDDTEWRFSFSKAELLLIHSWTNVQKLVYHKLRVIKKNMSKHCGGDKNKAWQTYYFKTLMFWACEEFPQVFWNEQNINICVRTLLLRFLQCLDDKFCPNYFIPECNIMSHLKNEGNLHKELKTVQKFLKSEYMPIIVTEEVGMIAPDRSFEYVCLIAKQQSLPLIEELTVHLVHYLTECEWFLPGMKNLHAAIEAHLRLMSVDSVTERQTSKDCLENFNCTLLKREEFESYEGLNANISLSQNWITIIIRKLFRNSNLIYRRKCHKEDSYHQMIRESFPSLLHGVTSAYRANFYFTAMRSYKESLRECETSFEVFMKSDIGGVVQNPSDISSNIPVLLCNSLSQLFDEHLQVILGFATLHRNISFSKIPIIATSHEVCLKMNAWEFLKYIHIQCKQKLSSISKPTAGLFPDFDRPYMSQLVDNVPFSVAILFAALRQSGAYKTPLMGRLIPHHFRHVSDPRLVKISQFNQSNMKPEPF